jgi:hypothetical protein
LALPEIAGIFAGLAALTQTSSRNLRDARPAGPSRQDAAAFAIRRGKGRSFGPSVLRLENLSNSAKGLY